MRTGEKRWMDRTGREREGEKCGGWRPAEAKEDTKEKGWRVKTREMCEKTSACENGRCENERDMSEGQRKRRGWRQPRG